ncbi:MAG: amidohydrolase family protein [Actinobacteria bacterium]|nr:amidohydrolase family protein [Actinomycetota bacterium]
MSLTLSGALLLDDEGDLRSGWVSVDGDLITGVGFDESVAGDVRLEGRTILPGFVDMHCHGGGAASYVSGDAEQIARAALTHRAHGTTTTNASLVSATYDDLAWQIRALIPFVDDGTLHGIHLEGPWISRDFCGAHDPATLRDPDPDEVSRILEIGEGRIAMVTLAPELPGAVASIERIVAAGAVAAIGHTGADADHARVALDVGATVATHLFNAMPPLLHRAAGPVGVLLTDSRVVVELIADGHHLGPEVVSLTMMTARERSALITDAMAAAGAGDGTYVLGDLRVQVTDGVARLASNGSLAGSTLFMDSALRCAVRTAGVPLADASYAASAVPARALGLADRGTIAVGQRADLVVLDDEWAVERVMRAGTFVAAAG